MEQGSGKSIISSHQTLYMISLKLNFENPSTSNYAT